MTPAQRVWLERAQRRLANLEPDLRTAYLLVLKNITQQMSEAELTAAIANGTVSQVIDAILSDPELDRAFGPLQHRQRAALERSYQYAAADVPPTGGASGGLATRSLAVRFDWLSPTVVQAVQTMESRALATLKADIRATVRQAVTLGIGSGDPPSAVARDLRSVIGLSPNQAQYVRNLRAELEAGQYGAARGRALLDRRFNLDKLDTLSEAERAKRIDTIVETYRTRMVAHNANVNTALMTKDAYREGQRLAWMQAQADGLVPQGYRIQKTWIHLDPQPDPRPEHQALHGETVPIDHPYSTGQMSAGLGDYGCHCLDRFTIAKAA